MYEERLPLNAVILGSLSGGISLGTPFSPFLTPTWALLIGCLSGFLVAVWIKVTTLNVLCFFFFFFFFFASHGLG